MGGGGGGGGGGVVSGGVCLHLFALWWMDSCL